MMTLSIWDTAAIAAWIVLWLSLLGLFISFLGVLEKRRKQRNEIFEKLRKSSKTQEEFDEMVRMLQQGDSK